MVHAHCLHFHPVEKHIFESQNKTNLHFNTLVSFYLYKEFFFLLEKSPPKTHPNNPCLKIS